MAGLGLWSGKRDKGGHSSIGIGEVAVLFHTEVFVPVLQHFERDLPGPNPN